MQTKYHDLVDRLESGLGSKGLSSEIVNRLDEQTVRDILISMTDNSSTVDELLSRLDEKTLQNVLKDIADNRSVDLTAGQQELLN